MFNTLRAYVDYQAETRPEAIYLIAPEAGLSMTFAGLKLASLRLSNYLASRGITPGEKVALLMHNGFQTCRLFIGAIYGGYCVTPINLLAHPLQLEYVLEHCDARIIFAATEQMDKLRSALTRVNREIIRVECAIDAREFLPQEQGTVAAVEQGTLAEVTAENPALLMYTSGTTGKPKGVVLSNLAVISGGKFVSAAHQLCSADRVLATLPLYHINAQIVTAISPLVHGGSLVLPHRFSTRRFWELVALYRCTWINLVPTMIAYLLEANGCNQRNVSALKFCRSASAPLPPSQHRAFEEKFNIGVIETMGLTETAAPCFSNPLEPASRKIGSPGKPFGSEAKIIDADGNILPPEVPGEIMVRGANLMSHYYKDPVQTAKAFTRDGWLHTGDLGYLDHDGFLFVTGRLKELIIKGGENIAPREIDEILIRHPAVLEAAAVGIPDPHYGQEIMACIVLRPEQGSCENELREYCIKELGTYKTPARFHFLAELPKGPSGKVQRLKLLECLSQSA